MSRIRSGNTRPELALRSALWHRGFRFRVNVRRLPGTPDIVLARYRTVIFVNGCFWHGHQGCRKFVMPRSNTAFWRSKIVRNRQRDVMTSALLESMGWFVVTVWECELSRKSIGATVERLEGILRENSLRHAARLASRREYRLRMKEMAIRRREVMEMLKSGAEMCGH